MEKKKKRLIILSVIAGVLIFIVLLSSAVFRIKSASVEYQTTLTILSREDLNKMIEDAGLPYGKSIFFSSLKENISIMEKNNPYVKVNGIERKFPNSLVVLVSERVPVVRVSTANGDYVLDNDMKVLNIARSVSEFNAQTGEHDLPELIVADNFNLSVEGLTKGDFVDNKVVKDYVDAFYRGAVTPSKNDSEIAISLISSIDSIKIGYSVELEKVVFDITYTGCGLTSKIVGDNNLIDCVYKIVNTVNQSLATGEEYEYVNCTDGVFYAKKK